MLGFLSIHYTGTVTVCYIHPLYSYCMLHPSTIQLLYVTSIHYTVTVCYIHPLYSYCMLHPSTIQLLYVTSIHYTVTVCYIHPLYSYCMLHPSTIQLLYVTSIHYTVTVCYIPSTTQLLYVTSIHYTVTVCYIHPLYMSAKAKIQYTPIFLEVHMLWKFISLELTPPSLPCLCSHKLLRSPRKPARKISKIPFKVLDAPELQDDFYLNLVDWSAGNLLSVGLGACVYLWSACTSQVTRLCDLSVDGDSVTSVCWNERGSLVAVGTHKGYVQIWDAAGGRKLTSLEGHSARVGALAWNGEQLSSGSRDRVILQRDVRTPPSAERRLQGHRQEVCGLKWSPDHQHLASGGNDNKLLVWNSSSLLPMQQYSDHLAAVKAIAWSPHQHGLLVSGGGTADRCLRFWNTLTGQPLQSTDTGSQVCNLAWSKHANELVSTHGYSQNQILVWKYPSLNQVAKLTGHSYRVLYLAVSPDGEAIVTGAGDETLRFWNVFSKTRCTKESKSVLNLFTRIR
ncbi:fizzy-related protein homolog isoform X3 [Oncorhynchus kisutch]|uniref:Fizzy-related protein homolog n=1 Tax=Oncorhynchus kisutch TaxID=8019 RepID=A0A8C7JB55_ONCKI|nr:fizzy-related protein homolog isoform X3 [Oncorhynchus kisutch]